MKKSFYAVYINDEHSEIVKIQTNRKYSSIVEHFDIDTDKLSDFLVKKKNIFCIIATQDTINETITLQQGIKKDNILKTLLLKKIRDTIGKKEVLINYQELEKNQFDETVTYQVDGVFKEELEAKLNLIPNWETINGITNDKFALYNIAQQCYNPQQFGAYIVAYTYGKKLLVLAINHDGKLLFERTSVINQEEKEQLYSTLVDEITQTVNYCKSQFRNVTFETILLGGSLVHSDIVAEQIFLSNNLKVAILYPNSFIKNIHYDEAQNYLIPLGSIYTKKSQQYLPKKYLSLKQFKYFSLFVYFLSAIVFSYSIISVYGKYSEYNQALTTYKNTKITLLDMVERTNKYSTKELETIYKHLDIARKYLYNHPTDFALKIKQLIDRLEPKTVSYKIVDGTLQFSFLFQKDFTTLKDLYKFQKEFYKIFDEINKDQIMEFNEMTDYKTLQFVVEIKEAKSQQKKNPQKRRKV